LREHNLDVDLFPSEFMASVEDQNRDFTRDQRYVANLVVEAARQFVINPRFMDDMARLDGSFKVESIAGPQTISSSLARRLSQKRWTGIHAASCEMKLTDVALTILLNEP